MRYIEALEEYEPLPDDPPSLFTAGGIKNCENWQERYCKSFEDTPLILLNPRRLKFSGTADDDTAQVDWEFRHLRKATAISFWFSVETLNPITLFELGSWSASGKTIFVGCHPQYQKRRTVIRQLQLLRPEVEVVDSLEMLARLVRNGLLKDKKNP